MSPTYQMRVTRLPRKQCKNMPGPGVYTSLTEPATVENFDHLVIRSKLCTLSLPFKRCVVPPVSCKRKADLCKFLSIQKFLRTRVKGVNKTSCDIVDHNDTCVFFICVYWKPSRKMVTRNKKEREFV